MGNKKKKRTVQIKLWKLVLFIVVIVLGIVLFNNRKNIKLFNNGSNNDGKNGSETIMSFSGNNVDKTSSKTFTLNSNTIQLYIKFKCDNDTWLPSGHIGIQSLIIE